MLMSFGSKGGWLVLVAAAIALVAAPVVEATPLDYNFTVNVTSGALLGTVENGNFSYDSSSIIAGSFNEATGLLTSLDFTFNGTPYHAATANTGALLFDDAGNLSGFAFGNDCDAGDCQVVWNSNDWLVSPGLNGFWYGNPTSGTLSKGNVTYARAVSVPVPVPVPEPDTLSLFGLGTLMLGLFVGRRRRVS